MLAPRHSAIAAFLFAALPFLHACASPGDGVDRELLYDAKIWNPAALSAGFAAAGVPAKLSGNGAEGGGVAASFETLEDGRVSVRLHAADAAAAKLLPAISNGIGMALVPKDKIRKRPGWRP